MKIIIPSDVRYLRSVRLAVGGLGMLVDFDIDAMEDIRIGVDELCGTVIEVGDGTDIEVRVRIDPGSSIRIECTSPMGTAEVDDDRFTFSKRILSVVSDSYGIETNCGIISCWLERSRSDWRADADVP